MTTKFNIYLQAGFWRRKRQPTPVFFPGEYHGQKAGYSPWGNKESDTTQQLKQQQAGFRTRQGKNAIKNIVMK